jgi:hypothetical protein
MLIPHHRQYLPVSGKPQPQLQNFQYEMKFSSAYKKTLSIITLTCPFSLLFLSYKNSPVPMTTSISNIIQKDCDQVIQVGLNYANGYTGENSIVISEASINYKCNFLRLQYDTITPKDLWIRIMNKVNNNSFAKISSGRSEQDRDGTDTIYFIKTKFKKYSFANGYGKEFDQQKELLSILTEQFGIYLEKAIAIRNEGAYR